MAYRKITVIDGKRRVVEITEAEWLAENPPVSASTDPNDYNLTPAQFKWLLAASGLDDVLSTVLDNTKASDRAVYADLQLNLARDRFLFSVTMDLVTQMQSMGAVPQGADVSEATIGALWMQAKDK